MRKIFIAICLLAFASCGGGKKKGAFWLLGLAAGDSNSTTAVESDGVAATVNTTTTNVTDGFAFETTQTVGITVTVTDSSGPVSGAVVTVTDPAAAEGESLFAGVTDSNGQVTGSVTVDSSVDSVEVTVQAGETTSTYTADIDNASSVSTNVNYEGETGDLAAADQDSDGMPDAQDDYPADPSRATLVKLPASGQSIIAYEDLYPSAGDADFNDYVVRVTNEEDLDAAGKIRRVRGSYTHMARGAGYKHTLHIKLPSVAFSYTLNRYAANGTLESTSTGQKASAEALEILPSSDTTISQSNTSASQTLVTGKKASIELVLDTPSVRASVGDAPYDLYIKVINTSKEVHFPRLYTKADGSDQYMDSNGFPWALQVPNQWNWPLESDHIENGYAGFQPWYLSMGASNQNWYESFNASHVFSAGAPASYIGQAYASRAVLFLTILIGAGGLALILAARRKQTQN